MGGGRNNFLKQSTDSTGVRMDEDLVLKWKDDKNTRFGDKKAVYMTNKDELLSTDMTQVDYVLGKALIIVIFSI